MPFSLITHSPSSVLTTIEWLPSVWPGVCTRAMPSPSITLPSKQSTLSAAMPATPCGQYQSRW
ncbi:hypothetical protein [Rhodanobacter lindaniclasticus]